MNTLSIRINIPKDIAVICSKSIELETKNTPRRSEVELQRYNEGLEIEIKSNDLHALRASLNTYIRWIIMCFDLISEKNNT